MIVAVIAALYSQYTEEIMTQVDKYSGIINDYSYKYTGKYLINKKDNYYDEELFPEDIMENMENLENIEDYEEENANIREVEELFTEYF